MAFPSAKSVARPAALLIFVAAITSGCATTGAPGMKADMAGIPTGIITKTMETRGESRTYAVYVPRGYDPAKEWPLVVFLHGRGERGDDGLLQTDVGIGHAIRKNPGRFPCIVVMPQCPDTGYWNAAFEDIDTCIADTLAAYTIDEDRMYLTGLSMGGYGTWTYGAKNAGRFAALIPICGGGRPKDAEILAKVPIRAFHGDADSVVSPNESQKMVDVVKAAGGDVELTLFPDVGHNSWDDTYGDPKVIKWMLSQRRGG